MSALIGSLRVSLSADTANFEAGMKRAQRSTQTAASGIQKATGLISNAVKGMVAGLSVGVLVRAGAAALEYAGHLTELAETLGLTSKDLQTFSYAAGQVGVSQEELQQGIQKLTISMGRAQVGSAAQVKAFNAIGISIDDLKGKDTGEVFRMMAEKLQNVSDRSQRAAVEVALFGKAGAKLDNLLSGAEGKLGDLSEAAEKLGIVLSDKQIQDADRTADKIEALKTVLKARIAGEVADNADAIFQLADSLANLVSFLARASKAWEAFTTTLSTQYSIPALFNQFVKGDAYGYNTPGKSVTVKLPPAKSFVKSKPMGGGSLSQFLGSGGGGSKHGGGGGGADHSAQDALNAAHQFDQDLRRAQMDVLHATQDLAIDYVERTSIGIEILNAEKAAFDAEQKYQVALFKLTKGKEGLSETQAAQLKAENDKTDALKRQALLEEEQAQRRQDVAMLVQTDFDTQKDKLGSELQLAKTAKEQRDIQLQLLDLSYRQERARLEAVLADEKASDAAKEDARRRLLGLNQTYANDRQGVVNSTRGPMEDYFSQVPKNAAEAQQAMEALKVQGIDGAINSLIALTDGFGSFRDAALQAIKQVLAEMLKMQLMKLAFSLFGGGGGGIPGFSAGSQLPVDIGGGGSLFSGGGVPGFATGGSMMIGGFGGTDNNVLSMNGLPIARVSRGEAMHIVPNGGDMGGGNVINFHINGNPTRATMDQIAARTRSAIAGANRRGV